MRTVGPNGFVEFERKEELEEEGEEEGEEDEEEKEDGGEEPEKVAFS